MRAWWTLVLAAIFSATASAQDGGPADAPPGPAAEEPKEPPAWKLPEKDARKLQELVAEYLGGPAKDRADVLRKIEKVVEKPVEGHVMLEDVAAVVGMANRARGFNPKLKKGQSVSMKVAGSHIDAGATLVVDDAETFSLAKNATGKNWVVGKRATSTPGGRTVQQIWSDGAAHRIAVRNPDGTVGPAVTL